MNERERAAFRALLERAREEVTGGLEMADELIDVDADVRSLLTGGMAFEDRESLVLVMKKEGVDGAEDILGGLEDRDVLSIERETYVRDPDGQDQLRTIVSVTEDVLDAVME